MSIKKYRNIARQYYTGIISQEEAIERIETTAVDPFSAEAMGAKAMVVGPERIMVDVSDDYGPGAQNAAAMTEKEAASFGFQTGYDFIFVMMWGGTVGVNEGTFSATRRTFNSAIAAVVDMRGRTYPQIFWERRVW